MSGGEAKRLCCSVTLAAATYVRTGFVVMKLFLDFNYLVVHVRLYSR